MLDVSEVRHNKKQIVQEIHVENHPPRNDKWHYLNSIQLKEGKNMRRLLTNKFRFKEYFGDFNHNSLHIILTDIPLFIGKSI